MSQVLLKAMARVRVARAKLPGQGSIEWTLIVALIGLALVAGLMALQGALEGKISEVGNFISNA